MTDPLRDAILTANERFALLGAPYCSVPLEAVGHSRKGERLWWSPWTKGALQSQGLWVTWQDGGSCRLENLNDGVLLAACAAALPALWEQAKALLAQESIGNLTALGRLQRFAKETA